jgi:ABC-type Fe3+-siderophore transport system permease subunit
MKPNKTYLLLTALLLTIEIYIAVYVRDEFIRPIFGDFLSVILLYCFFKTIFDKSVFRLALVSLLIAYFLEILQFLQFLKTTGLGQYRILKILIGSSFSWGDILAYTLGFVFILIVESLKRKKFNLLQR